MNGEEFERENTTDTLRLHDCVSGCVRILEHLKAGIPCDLEDFQARLEQCNQLADTISARIESLATRLAIEPPKWRNQNEFEAITLELTTLLREEARRIDVRECLTEVARLLQGGHFINPTKRARLTVYDGVREAAAAELIAASNTIASLPGPKDPAEWLIWAWDQTPDALIVIGENAPSFARLLMETDSSQWVPPNNPVVRPAPQSTTNSQSTLPSTTSNDSLATAVPNSNSSAKTEVMPVVTTEMTPDPLPETIPHGRLPDQTSIEMCSPEPNNASVKTDPTPERNAPKGSSLSKLLFTKALRGKSAGLPQPSVEHRSPVAERSQVENPQRVKIASSETNVRLQQSDAADTEALPPCETELEQIGQPDNSAPVLPGSPAVPPVESPLPKPDVVPANPEASESFWVLLEGCRHGLAAHLLESLESMPPNVPSPALLRAVALAPALIHMSGEVAIHVERELRELSDFSDSQPVGEAIEFLLAAATLRPALLAPGTGADHLLSQLALGTRSNKLSQLCAVVCEFSKGRLPLEIEAAGQKNTVQTWEENLSRVIRQTNAWMRDAVSKTLKFQTATAIWQSWVKNPDGPVHMLFRHMMDPKFSGLPHASRAKGIDETREWAGHLGDQTWIRGRVDSDDARYKQRRSIRIVGPPFDRIVDYAAEAVQFAFRWLDLQQNTPADRESYLAAKSGHFRDSASRLIPSVIEELNARIDSESTPFMRVAVQACQDAVGDVRSLIKHDAGSEREEGAVYRLLHADLLLTNAPVTSNGTPDPSFRPKLAASIIDTVREGFPGLEEAFDRRTETRDHVATRLIIDLIKKQPGSSETAESLEFRREEAIVDCREALRLRLVRTRDEVEQALAFGWLKETQHTNLMATVRQVEQRGDSVLRFSSEYDALDGVVAEIKACRDAKVELARKEIQNRLKLTHPALRRIHQALDLGDVFTATDYLEKAIRGDELPSDEAGRDVFAEFFPSRAEELERQFGERGAFGGLVSAIERGQEWGGLSLAVAPGTTPDTGLRSMFVAWATAAKNKNLAPENVRRIFEGLGFTVNKVEPRGTTSRFDVSTLPVEERSLCPLPAFGSDARGLYRVLGVFDHPHPRALINQVGQGYSGPTIVFFFGRLTVIQRREIAQIRTDHRRTFVILDDTLLAFLAGETGSRMAGLFACGLPFTHDDPYQVTSSLVSPEMFYGRKVERESLLNPRGSCLVYGGRQLGKTALLRDVEREFKRVPEQMALYFALRDERVGVDRELWPFLAEKFKDKGLVPASVPKNIGGDALLGHVRDWLDKNPAQRRLLLLLDEADQFLLKDSDGGERGPAAAFEAVNALKRLMENSERRFKVVFAGLHNVQRTTRLANHPLAHFGRPICIGPLLDEWKEARSLIEKPFAALGYRFASPDLVTRVLSHTNYYPSLIQLYCHSLLRHVTKSSFAAFDLKNVPPYVITPDHIERAYQDEALRGAIRERFTWTLQLDQRYEVLAAIIAHRAVAENATAIGLTAAEAKEYAESYWKVGFSERIAGTDRPLAEDAVHALLDEMVGLGILRHERGRYGLRSPNILLLMGTEEEIQATLVRDREPSLDRLPVIQFRPPLADTAGNPDRSRRSPLSLGQESELRRRANGVAVVFGVAAAGLADLRTATDQSFGQSNVIAIEKTGLQEFAADLDKACESRATELTVIWIGSGIPWNSQWVDAALDKLDRLVAEKYVRVMFVADPQKTWELSGESALDQLRERGTRIYTLEPWSDTAIRQWLDDTQLGPAADKTGREHLLRVTGGWPHLLEAFASRIQKRGEVAGWNQSVSQTEALLDQKLFRKELTRMFGFDIPMVSDVLRCAAQYGEASETELDQLVNAELGEKAGCQVGRVLRWGELLRITYPAPAGWTVDPLVARLLMSDA